MSQTKRLAAAAIPFNRPYRAPEELERVAQALASGRISGDGPFTARATHSLEALMGGGASVLLTTSGTHALELGALLLGLGPGDEVVMPSFTFSSTANAVLLRGATVRFADIDPGTLSMGVAELEAALTPQTTAVVAMPYGGVSADMDQLAALCGERGLSLMEDNAHGLFSKLDGRALGTFGAVSALSFHQTKNISCGEGGALIINDHELVASAEILREKGTDRSRFLRGEVDKYTWRSVGSSYLPSDILAAVLSAQLDCAGEIQRRRMAAWDACREVLEPRAGELPFALQTIPAGLEHPAHVFAVVLAPGIDRARVARALAEEGVKAVSHYVPLHRAPAHEGGEDLPVTDRVAAGLLRLPLFVDLTPDDARRAVRALLDVLERALDD